METLSMEPPIETEMPTETEMHHPQKALSSTVRTNIYNKDASSSNTFREYSTSIYPKHWDTITP